MTTKKTTTHLGSVTLVQDGVATGRAPWPTVTETWVFTAPYPGGWCTEEELEELGEEEADTPIFSVEVTRPAIIAGTEEEFSHDAVTAIEEKFFDGEFPY